MEGSESSEEWGYLDGLEPDEHVVLQPVEGGVEPGGAQLVEPPADQAHRRVLLEGHVLQDLDEELGGQLHEGELAVARAPPPSRASRLGGRCQTGRTAGSGGWW